jgi:hypothetical protein
MCRFAIRRQAVIRVAIMSFGEMSIVDASLSPRPIMRTRPL